MTLPVFAPWPVAPTPAAEPVPSQDAVEMPAQARQHPPRQAIVFVHGIFSNHASAFADARQQMAADPLLATMEFHYFDYAYWESMETNGQRLAQALCLAGFQRGDNVAIVAHSMGGLVARLAILWTRMDFIRIVFLLGTPNAGALRLSQLTPLQQLLHRATNYFFAQYPQWAGIASLSNAAQLLDERRNGNALDVDYVSIPGCFFHEDRDVWDVQRLASSIGFSAFETALLRRLAIRMTRPHDGIVEESSNNLIKCPRPTEKMDSYGGARGTSPATYAHLFLAACNEVNHVQIHSHHEIIGIIGNLIAAKFGLVGSFGDLQQWFASISPSVRIDQGIKVVF
jgi:pimeloyl-ACP methyl ester carboxylesterase